MILEIAAGILLALFILGVLRALVGLIPLLALLYVIGLIFGR